MYELPSESLDHGVWLQVPERVETQPLLSITLHRLFMGVGEKRERDIKIFATHINFKFHLNMCCRENIGCAGKRKRKRKKHTHTLLKGMGVDGPRGCVEMFWCVWTESVFSMEFQAAWKSSTWTLAAHLPCRRSFEFRAAIESSSTRKQGNEHTFST